MFAMLGFNGDAERGWTRVVSGNTVQFRLLHRLDDLRHAEALQEEVFGVSERDLIPANELVVVPETGGAVLGAFLAGSPGRAAAVIVGWGGFVGRPRIVSDFLAVRPEARNLGFAAALKRLQAAIAVDRGFVEIVWTVDPLRAANAHLNFTRLGAIGVAYEIDRYGSTFATGLYGGMPTDRLHVRWDITEPRIIDLLRTGAKRGPATQPVAAREFSSGNTEETAYVSIPDDIDSLVAADLDIARAWRYRVRDQLLGAFAEGFVVDGFLPGVGSTAPRLALRRRA
jgi:predicted GNAT superfamily acetyltransferase